MDKVPTEILLSIYKCLNLHDLTENCLQVCAKWRQNIALFVLLPILKNVARRNSGLDAKFLEMGTIWNCENPNIILSMFQAFTRWHKCLEDIRLRKNWDFQKKPFWPYRQKDTMKAFFCKVSMDCISYCSLSNGDQTTQSD